MVEKQYKVVGPQEVAGHKTGETFAWTVQSELEAMLVEGGHLVVVSAPETKAPCPACAETGKAADKKRTYATAAEMAEHYASDHPALAAPGG